MQYVRPTPEKVAELRDKWWEYRWKRRMKLWYEDLARGHNVLYKVLNNQASVQPN